jgi:hypothetical protein
MGENYRESVRSKLLEEFLGGDFLYSLTALKCAVRMLVRLLQHRPAATRR